MDSLISTAFRNFVKGPLTGDDYVDRLHYFVTVGILMAFAMGTGFKEYISSPINCWTPVEFNADSNSYFDHINDYCWTHSLRYPDLPNISVTTNTDQGISPPVQQNRDFDIEFTKWVTFVFIVQACLFKFPNFIWRRLNTSSGTDLQKIRDLVSEAQNAKDATSKKLRMDEVVAYFEDWITGYRSYKIRITAKRSAKCLAAFCLGEKTGNYLSSLYIFVKILNILNVVLNFVLMSLFMNFPFWKYGFILFRSDNESGNGKNSAKFPRLLLCDFVLQGGKETSGATPSQEIYQVQCLITINVLLEKLLAVEWFWLVFLSGVTVINLISWGMKIKPPCSRILFARSYLKTLKNASSDLNSKASFTKNSKASLTNPPESFSKDLKGFIEEYMRSDGVFVVRLLELNASKTLVAELVKHLWNRYRIMNTCQLPLYIKDHRDDSDKNKEVNNNAKESELDSEEPVVIITGSFL